MIIYYLLLISIKFITSSDLYLLIYIKLFTYL